ncbi:MAG: tRNA (guanosine(37)-N1)-methyltransferase TrmD [Clostridiales bacterium]|nr:MAG: tRNA (guanosine(37)-N1)-methyltransferase TrmD [Clostridiales bacterium]
MNKIFVLTLFPDAVMGVLSGSIIGNAIKNGIVDIHCIQIRDYTLNRQAQVDDYPYGGGMGMLLMADPLYRAWRAAAEQCAAPRTILLSAQGAPYTQHAAKRLSLDRELIFVCGHYEGVDQRFIDECVDEEISIGDFVLTGGEIAALAVIDSVCRLLPGVLADESCYTDESHWSGVLEYPQYTRPEIWHDRRVPDVLLSGHHEKIRKWRRAQALRVTRERRPDLFSALPLSDEDKRLLDSETT